MWVDPPCGDGICEAPFEFPEYSWFGCRADCGILSEVVDLTAVRISITWDFNHPPNSIPAAVSRMCACLGSLALCVLLGCVPPRVGGLGVRAAAPQQRPQCAGCRLLAS